MTTRDFHNENDMIEGWRPIPEGLRTKRDFFPQAVEQVSPAQMGQHSQPHILFIDFSKREGKDWIGEYVAVMRPHHEHPTFEIHPIEAISSSGEVVRVQGMRFRTKDGWRFEADARLKVRIVQPTDEIRALAGHQHRVSVLKGVLWDIEDSDVVLSVYYAYIKAKQVGGFIDEPI